MNTQNAAKNDKGIFLKCYFVDNWSLEVNSIYM